MDDPKQVAKAMFARVPDATGGEVKTAAKALFGPGPFASKVIGCYALEAWLARNGF